MSVRMAQHFDYLIVGGGNAAGYACREFVAQGVAAGKVGIVAQEPVVPYERPALTKAYLHPPTAKVRARLPGFHTCVGGGGERQTPEWYGEKGISVVSGSASDVDLLAKRVKVGDGEIGYEKLIIATGASALRLGKFGLKGDDLQNVFYVRNEGDAAALVKAMEAGVKKVVCVGGGYIGLECAAALSGWGAEVTMVFPEAHCMPRLFNPTLAQWLEDAYTARGIKFLKGPVAKEFVGEGKVTSVLLDSGNSLEADLVVVGIGASANTQVCEGLKKASGGFEVTSSMQTSDPSVFAIGDVCAFPSMYGGLTRCEHVDHARKSASQAVKAALGLAPEPYTYLPYFYSRLFEYSDAPIVFNFFGDQGGECQTVARGERSIGAIWVKDGKVVGALLMGSPGPSAEDMAKLKELAASQPPAADPDVIFSSAKL